MNPAQHHTPTLAPGSDRAFRVGVLEVQVDQHIKHRDCIEVSQHTKAIAHSSQRLKLNHVGQHDAITHDAIGLNVTAIAQDQLDRFRTRQHGELDGLKLVTQ